MDLEPLTDMRPVKRVRSITRALWPAALMVLAGCGPEEVLGRVSAVEAPDTVEVEQRFGVIVTTWGPNGCWRKERTDVTVRGLTATIAPYDVDTGGMCTHAPVEITHTAELSFAQTGVGVIRVRGRDGTGRELSVVVE